jgi:hypothetical protein
MLPCTSTCSQTALVFAAEFEFQTDRGALERRPGMAMGATVEPVPPDEAGDLFHDAEVAAPGDVRVEKHVRPIDALFRWDAEFPDRHRE